MDLPLTDGLDKQSGRKVICALPSVGDTRFREANLSANRVTGPEIMWSNLTFSDTVHENTHDFRRGIDKTDVKTEETSAASDTTVDSVAPSTPPEPCAKRRKYRGVRQRSKVKWAAQVHDPEKSGTVWLGTYDTPEEAAEAYDRAALRFHGPRAILNFPVKSRATATAVEVSHASGSDMSSDVTDGSVVTHHEDLTESVPSESRTMLEYLLQSREIATVRVDLISSAMFDYLLQSRSSMIDSHFTSSTTYPKRRKDSMQPLYPAHTTPFSRPPESLTTAHLDLDLHL